MKSSDWRSPSKSSKVNEKSTYNNKLKERQPEWRKHDPQRSDRLTGDFSTSTVQVRRK